MSSLLDNALSEEEELVEDVENTVSSEDTEDLSAPNPSVADDIFGDDDDDDWVDDEDDDAGSDALLKSGGTVAEIDPEDEEISAGPDLEEAEGLMAMGLHQEALAILDAASGLKAATLSKLSEGPGLGQGSVWVLRDAVDDAEDAAWGRPRRTLSWRSSAGRSGKHDLRSGISVRVPAFRITEAPRYPRG